MIELLWARRLLQISISLIALTIISTQHVVYPSPKYEELKPNEQELYHSDKDIYNKFAGKGGKSLYLARSGTAGETWIPLIEKAYASYMATIPV